MRDSSISDSAQRKQQARSEALSRREGLPDSLRAEKSTLIAGRLMDLELFQKARCVFMYVAVRSEVQTLAIIQAALTRHKKVCVPLIDTQAKQMIACAISDPIRDLQPGVLGIPEPYRETCAQVSVCDIDLVIVPGLAFTVQGHRIGYGGGFYDRFLSTYSGVDCALAFEEQIVAALPFDRAHDAAVSSIITEQRVIWC